MGRVAATRDLEELRADLMVDPRTIDFVIACKQAIEDHKSGRFVSDAPPATDSATTDQDKSASGTQS